MADAQQAQDQAGREREGVLTRVGIEGLRILYSVFPPLPAQGGAAGGLHVAIPIYIWAVGQGEYKAVLCSGGHHGRRVEFATAPADVPDEANWAVAGARDLAGDAVGETLINVTNTI